MAVSFKVFAKFGTCNRAARFNPALSHYTNFCRLHKDFFYPRKQKSLIEFLLDRNPGAAGARTRTGWAPEVAMLGRT